MTGAGMCEEVCCQHDRSDNFDIDFVAVIESHIKMRFRLLNYINGEETEAWSPEEAGAEKNCHLGCWLQGGGKKNYGHFSSFRRLEVEHSLFHGFAELILSKVLEGKTPEASDLLKNDFSHTTRSFLVAINEMSEQIRKRQSDRLHELESRTVSSTQSLVIKGSFPQIV